MKEPAKNGALLEPILKDLEFVPIPGWPNATLAQLKPEAHSNPETATR